MGWDRQQQNLLEGIFGYPSLAELSRAVHFDSLAINLVNTKQMLGVTKRGSH